MEWSESETSVGMYEWSIYFYYVYTHVWYFNCCRVCANKRFGHTYVVPFLKDKKLNVLPIWLHNCLQMWLYTYKTAPVSRTSAVNHFTDQYGGGGGARIGENMRGEKGDGENTDNHSDGWEIGQSRESGSPPLLPFSPPPPLPPRWSAASWQVSSPQPLRRRGSWSLTLSISWQLQRWGVRGSTTPRFIMFDECELWTVARQYLIDSAYRTLCCGVLSFCADANLNSDIDRCLSYLWFAQSEGRSNPNKCYSMIVVYNILKLGN